VARLFVAVRPPAPVLAALAALSRPVVHGVRWTTPDQWHATLRFLGEVADVEAAVAAVSSVGPRVAPAEVVAGPAVIRLGRNVVCVPVAGLEAVAAAVVDATGHLGRPPERRRFTGHLTLARLKDPRVATGLAMPPFEARWPVDAVELVQSRLRPSGAEYETVVSVPLVGAAA
jgi:2'-5' RNA ligase